MVGFYYNIDKESIPQKTIVILGYKGENPDEVIEAWVVPTLGSNLCRFCYGGKEILEFDLHKLANKDFTGTPVLYPTPNRVKNSVFTYKGVEYKQIKNGKAIELHGLVHNEPWEWEEPKVKGEEVILKTFIEFTKTSPMYEAFPFEHRL